MFVVLHLVVVVLFVSMSYALDKEASPRCFGYVRLDYMGQGDGKLLCGPATRNEGKGGCDRKNRGPSKYLLQI